VVTEVGAEESVAISRAYSDALATVGAHQHSNPHPRSGMSSVAARDTGTVNP
jgi:hypothetical protein